MYGLKLSWKCFVRDCLHHFQIDILIYANELKQNLLRFFRIFLMNKTFFSKLTSMASAFLLNSVALCFLWCILIWSVTDHLNFYCLAHQIVTQSCFVFGTILSWKRVEMKLFIESIHLSVLWNWFTGQKKSVSKNKNAVDFSISFGFLVHF